MTLPTFESEPAVRRLSPTWPFVFLVCAALMLAIRVSDAVEMVPASQEISAADVAQLDTDARKLLDAISLRLVVADFPSSDGTSQPTSFSSALVYSVLGEDGRRDRIEVDRQGRVSAIEWLGTANERRIELGSSVAPLLMGETPNELDDNGNGLVDEPGLVFVRRPDSLAVGLTLQAGSPGGTLAMSAVERTIQLAQHEPTAVD